MQIGMHKLLLEAQWLHHAYSTYIRLHKLPKSIKKGFPEEWTFLSLHRNVNEDHDGPVLTAFKERQVFIMTLILLRQSNFCSLPHWCLILLTAMYGWGTCDTLGHVTSFIGTTVSRSYQDRFFASLTLRLVETMIALLSQQLCGLMVLDNFQWGQQLREQRGGKSSKFLSGTTEMAHSCGIPPVRTRFSDLLAILAKSPPKRALQNSQTHGTQNIPAMCLISY